MDEEYQREIAEANAAYYAEMVEVRARPSASHVPPLRRLHQRLQVAAHRAQLRHAAALADQR